VLFRSGKSFVSLKKDDDVMTIELPRVIELIEQKAAALDAATLVTFGDTGIRIIKGRFGAYITDGTRKANLPKKREPEEVTVFEAEAYLAEAEATKKPVKKGRAAAKPKAEKPAAEKKPAKKAAAKKATGKTAKKTAKAKAD
jgi:DNA topoisomerase-1